MKLSFSTIGCPAYVWTDIYPMACDLGFDGIEIRGVAGNEFAPTAQPFLPRQRARTKAQLSRMGLQISCFSTSCELLNERGREEALREVTDYLELASEMGSPFVRVLLSRDIRPQGNVDDEPVIEALRELGDVASIYDVCVLIETEADYADSARLARVLDAVDSPHVGALWDLQHPYRLYGEDITAKLWHNVVGDDGLHFTIADTGWGKAVWGKFYGAWTMESCVLTYDFDRFHAHEILSLVDAYGVTTLCCPPTMYRLLMRHMMHDEKVQYRLTSLVYCTTAGEALNPDLFDFWKERTGLIIYEGFGQTETPLTIGNLNGSKPKPGSMGKIVPLYDTRILRGDGTECEDGETGEICIRYDPEHRPEGILVEYYRNPEKTAEAIYDGWYHTGDMAWRDEDDYLWYVGRNDDVIKSSGYRIGPTEIESVLLQHDAVRECAVTGVPDPVRGKAVKATIVLHSAFEGTPELTRELQAFVKRETAPYKYPRIIDYVDELPKTVNGKIRRVAIRKRDEEASTAANMRDKRDGLV